jgi:hypothetical protein
LTPGFPGNPFTVNLDEKRQLVRHERLIVTA